MKLILSAWAGPRAFDAWQGRRRLPIVQSIAPLVERMLERQELDTAKIVRIAVQVPQATLHDGTHSDMVASGMVVECNCQLDQPLPEFFLLGGSGAPDIFQNFVGLKEKGAIKKRDSTGQFARVHALLCHKPERPHCEHLDKE